MFAQTRIPGMGSNHLRKKLRYSYSVDFFAIKQIMVWKNDMDPLDIAINVKFLISYERSEFWLSSSK